MKGSSTAQLIVMSVRAHEGAAASHGARSWPLRPQPWHRETTRGPRAAVRLSFFTAVADSDSYCSARPRLCPRRRAYVAGVLSSTSSTSPRYSDTRRAASPEPMEHRRARGPGRAPLEPGLTTRVPALHGCRCSRRTTQRLATSVSKSAVAQIPLSFHSYFTPPDPSSSTQPPSCVNTPEPSMYSSSGFNSLHRARDSPTMF